MRAKSFEEYPHREAFIVRDWKVRGIRRRDVAVVDESTVYTEEDRGDGTHWTPYSVGFDIFFSYDEAFAFVGKQMDLIIDHQRSEEAGWQRAYSSVVRAFNKHNEEKTNNDAPV